MFSSPEPCFQIDSTFPVARFFNSEELSLIKSSQLLYLPSCNLIGHVNSSKISPLGVDHAVITVGFIHKSRCFAKWCKQFKIYLFVIYIINIRSADTYHWAVVVNIHITTYEQLLYMYIYFRTMLALDYPCVYIYI